MIDIHKEAFLAEAVINLEEGNLSQEDTLQLFQILYDTGIWKQLSSIYVNTIESFLLEGRIVGKNN